MDSILPALLKSALIEGNTSLSAELLTDATFEKDVKNHAMDLIPVVTERFLDRNDPLYGCCTQLLRIICETSNADDVLIQFVAEIEECQNDVKVATLLESLPTVIRRIPAKKLKDLLYVYDAIQRYLNSFVEPDYEGLEGTERLLYDVSDIMEMYREILKFYQTVVNLVTEQNDDKLKGVLTKFLVQLLASPLCYLSLNNEQVSKVAEDVIALLVKVGVTDIVHLNKMSANAMDWTVQVNEIGLASLFNFGTIPVVYTSKYLLEVMIPHINTFIKEDNVLLNEKAVDMALKLFESQDENSVPFMHLKSVLIQDFTENLCKLIVYNREEFLRKKGLKVLICFINVFEIPGKYYLILNLLSEVSHSGLKGFLITHYKQLLNDNLLCAPEYFVNGKLLKILKKCCNLPQGYETDLTANSDEIISTLNLLIYLAVRDTDNITHFWDFTKEIEEEFLNPLKKGLELSITHYEVEMKITKEDPSLYIIIPGDYQTPPRPTKEEKLESITSTLTCFDLISCLHSRVMELFDNH